MKVHNSDQLIERINRLKQQKRAVILAHYYTRPEVQQVADFLGDSLALSVKAQNIDADVILFAGVHFMAETAKVLCPQKKVLIPCPEAGCSLADSCQADEFDKFIAEHPGHTVVSYVNTTVEVKALTDVCCTSSNALKVIQSIPADRPIIFGPDQHLGSYIKRLTGRDNMLLWHGCCHVHDKFAVERLREAKVKYPEAKVVVHPECREVVVAEADYVGSTAGILEYCRKSDSRQFIVMTESGIITEMERLMPDKEFIPGPANALCDGACNTCEYMKMVNLENIAECLENESPEIHLDEEIRRKAERSILNMISIK